MDDKAMLKRPHVVKQNKINKKKNTTKWKVANMNKYQCYNN